MAVSVYGDGCRYCQPQTYIDMVEDELRKLNALEEAGVDNWEGYDYAMSLVEEE